MRILMVCLGNICRSPLAQGIMEKMIVFNQLDWTVDSAGTSGWHKGEQADRRSIAVAEAHGINISRQRSRQFVKKDFEEFDLILAMDSSNYHNILKLAQTDEDKEKVHLILNYSFPGENRAVPDPYYEGGFESVYAMLEDALEVLVRAGKSSR